MIETFFIGSGSSGPTLTPELVGGKAANLARLDRLGLRVPPALALGTSVWRDYVANGNRLPDTFREQIAAAMKRLEGATGLVFGGRTPLVVSVRSSPGTSMPGMLETVLDVGLNPDLVRGLIRRTGNAWLAWDGYRRLARSCGEVVNRAPSAEFDQLETMVLGQCGAHALDELDPVTMRSLALEEAALVNSRTTGMLPLDPLDQLVAAVAAVLQSWSAPRAAAYRRAMGIADDLGTGVLIQAMVFGNAGPRSGSGVGFTRNPSTGVDELFVDFAFNAQGEDVVSGRQVVHGAERLRSLLPDAYRELLLARRTLERGFLDMQDVEFTIEEGTLYFLQTRDAKRTPWAALQVAIDLVQDGLIRPEDALERLAAYDLDTISRSAVRAAGVARLAEGIPAVPGAVSGPLRLGNAPPDADEWRRAILVRRELATEDFPALVRASGLVTALGGRTSHAAVVARQLNTPCVVGCTGLEIDTTRRTCTIGGTRLYEGDVITIDGDTGVVYAGELPIITERPEALLTMVRAWRRERGERRSSGIPVANP